MAVKLPEINLTKLVREIWQEKLLLDYTIEVEDEEFRVHKVILASVSDYFKAMLTGGMMESQMDRVKLEGMNSLAVSNIIEYIYTNEISGAKASPGDLLACAVYLQIPLAIEAATQLLSQGINEKNCFDILLIFQTHCLKDAAGKTERYIKNHIYEVLELKRVESMSWENVATLVRLWDKSEWDLFLMVKEWVELDFENRKHHLNEVFLYDLDFNLLSPAVIEDIRKMKIYTESEGEDGSWHGVLDEAMDYHNLPTHRKVNENNLMRSKPSAVCFLQDENSKDTIYKLEKNLIVVTDIPPVPALPGGAAAVIEVDNFLFVCGNFTDTGTQNWYIFDPQTLAWTQIASFNTPRSDFALVYDTQHIYALGGRIELNTDFETVTDTIERYDLQTNTWTIAPFTLPLPIEKHHACLWLQYIFVIGGMDIFDDSPTLYACDPNQDAPTWIDKSFVVGIHPITHPCHIMEVMRFKNKEVIVLINNRFFMQYYDPCTNQWSFVDLEHLSTKLKWRDGGRMMADVKSNSLYFLNFARDTGEDSDSDSDLSEWEEQPLCVKWMLSAHSSTITEHVLPGFPGWERNSGLTEKNYIAAVLAFPPPSVRGRIPPVPKVEDLPS